ncbi:PRC-barrel domain-containing protein [Neptunicella sp.]|uniref:PRC-barrel domain-containing protein n=1 Tax=Neptunicella sp. TaxID=2125986 RepID=UPI003F68F03C
MTFPDIQIDNTEALAREKPAIIASKLLVGLEVCNHKKEKLGIIKELMIDPDSGKVVFAVMSFGGFWGMGERLTAVPWSALLLDGPQDMCILTMETNKFKSAPSFDSDSWPDMTDNQWASKIYNYYDPRAETANI